MSLPSRTSLRRGEACRLGGSGAMAQSCAITLKTTTKSIPQVRREKRVHLRLDVLGFAIPSGLSHASIISERQGAKSPRAKSNEALFEPAADAALNGD